MERRNLIIKSATKVIAREGYSSTRVQMIADDAGVAVGTIYHYFKSKEEILEYIYILQCDKLSDFLDILREKKASTTEKIEEYINFLIREMEENPDLLKVLIQLYLPEFKNNLAMKNAMIRAIGKLANVIEEGKESGEIANLEVCTFANIITHAVRGALNTFITDGTNYESRKKQLVQFIIKGIKG